MPSAKLKIHQGKGVKVSEVKRYYVERPATVFYGVWVEAKSADEALSRVKHPAFDNSEWVLDWDTMSWLDKFSVVVEEEK